MRILVVGVGRVGYRTLRYLMELFPGADILAVDIDKARLRLARDTLGVDGVQYEPGLLGRLAKEYDIAVTALPSIIGLRGVLELIDKCIDIVDVSFFSEDPYILEKIVEDCGNRLVVDAGFAPGYSNLVAGYVYHVLGVDDDIEIAVGGIPRENIPPIGYAITWNPRDLLEEYTRPARYIENGVVREKHPLEHIVRIKIEEIGELEGFLSDGLRTMLRNIKARNMREITLRWPGHLHAVKTLYSLGFLDKEEVEIGDTRVAPIDFTAKLLEKKLAIRTPDMAILVVTATKGENKKYREIALLFGTPDEPATPVFTALVHAYTVRVIQDKRLSPGIYPLEELYQFKFDYERYLLSKGVLIKTSSI